jgi:3-deoxy-D-manno-octulosonate 8-phosphate phosphatase (KDO 8-P phosphatase)
MPNAPAEALERARHVRLMVFDVDGVLTDGRLWYGPQGETLKAFSARDGMGMRLLAESGIALALLTSRRSEAVALRAAELRIAHVLQGSEEKHAPFAALLSQLGVAAEHAGYMGDDLVDLPVLRRCGFACAPADAPEPVLRHSHYVSGALAGAGAVREVCEFVLRAQGKLEGALAAYLA